MTKISKKKESLAMHLLHALGGIFLGISVPVIFLVGIFLAIQHPKIKIPLIHKALNEALQITGVAVNIPEVNGVIPFRMEIPKIYVKDESGSWLTVENIQFEWDFWTLIKSKKIKINRFIVGEIIYKRPPVFSKDFLQKLEESTSGYSNLFELVPWVPVFRVNHLVIKKLNVWEPVMGVKSDFTIKARTLNEPTGQRIAMRIQQIDKVKNPAIFEGYIILKIHGHHFDGTSEFHLKLGGHRLYLKTLFLRKDEAIFVKNMNLTGPGIDIYGNGSFGIGQQGKIWGEVKDLRQIALLLNKKMSGHLKFSSNVDNNAMSIDLEGYNFEFEEYKAQKMNCVIDVNEMLTGNGKFSAEGVEVNEHFLGDVEATATLGEGNGPFALKSTGPMSSEMHGEMAYETDFLAFTLKSLRLKYQDETLDLLEPAVVHFVPHFQIPSIKLGLKEGRLEGAKIALKKEYSGDITLKNIPFALIELFIPSAYIKGKADGDVHLGGTAKEPEFHAKFKANDVVILESKKAHRYTIDGIIDFKGNNLVWGADIKSPKVLDVRTVGKITDITRFSKSYCKGFVKGNANMSLVNPYLIFGDTLKGDVTLDLKWGGTVENPVLSGFAELRNGYYEAAELALAIRNINGKLRAQNRMLKLESFSATSEKGGVAKGSGWINFNKLTEPDVRISLDFVNFIIEVSGFFISKVNGGLVINGPGFGAAVTGAVKLMPTDINLDARLPDDVQNIKILNPREVKKIDKAIAERLERITKILPLNFKVDFGKGMLIGGHGIVSKWKGELKVLGDIVNPALEGTITCIRGKGNFLGKLFSIRKGEIIFDGGVQNDPKLNITAAKTIRDYDVQIEIRGHAKEPKIEFASNPGLPQEEIVSLLLFGKAAGQISITQTYELAATVASLKAGRQYDLMGKVKESFGLDTLEFTSGDSSKKGVDDETEQGFSGAIAVGKRLSDNVFVRFEQGIASAIGAGSVEIDLSRNFVAEIGIGGNRGAGGGINWVKRY